jgi:hypothetical protein
VTQSKNFGISATALPFSKHVSISGYHPEVFEGLGFKFMKELGNIWQPTLLDHSSGFAN